MRLTEKLFLQTQGPNDMRSHSITPPNYVCCVLYEAEKRRRGACVYVELYSSTWFCLRRLFRAEVLSWVP